MPFVSAKLPYTFSEEKLLNDLAICEEHSFSEHYNKADYSGSWRVIALRSPDGTTTNTNAISLTGKFEDSQLFEQCTYFKEVVETFECDKATIRLMNLAAGSSIKEHKDYELGYEHGIFRLHVPITTNPDVRFYIARDLVPMSVGECWYGNFSELHRVENNGATDRVHLVIDCLRNAWSDDLFGKLNYPFEEEGIETYDDATKRKVIEALKLLDLPSAKAQIQRLEDELKESSKGG